MAFAVNNNHINRVGCALLCIHIAASREVVNNVVIFVEVVIELALSLTTIALAATFLCVGLYTTNNQNSFAVLLHSA